MTQIMKTMMTLIDRHYAKADTVQRPPCSGMTLDFDTHLGA